ITVLGKLSIDAYAKLLSETPIGIALMVSPHPSYPPVEMALFGLQVISNRFQEKDLSADFANILSLETVNPETIAAHLVNLCKRFDQGEMTQHLPVFSGNTPPFPFIKQLLQDLNRL
ncbi:MAG: glycosyltransferase family 2 protein, partial [Bacteroidota bacterium]|nr:glycosyltransferase family 2 protein [Bacteroidota bacterium]